MEYFSFSFELKFLDILYDVLDDFNASNSDKVQIAPQIVDSYCQSAINNIEMEIEDFDDMREAYESKFSGKSFSEVIAKIQQFYDWDDDVEEFQNWASEWYLSDTLRVRKIEEDFLDFLEKESTMSFEEREYSGTKGFYVFIDLNPENHNEPMDSYDDAKKVIDEYLTRCAIAKEEPIRWEIYYQNKKGENLLVIDNLDCGKMQYLDVDNGVEYNFVKPSVIEDLLR